MAHHAGFFGLLLILSVAQAAYYIQTGTDKHFCGFKCYRPNGILQLRCNNINQLVAECSNSVPKIGLAVNQRISMNGFTGCWMLKNAQKMDTGSYELWFYYGSNMLVLKSMEIIVIDAVKIEHIISNRSLDGSYISLTVLFSGRNATVTWELDGGSLPARYGLKDDNRTLLIEDVSKQDANSILAVWVKNPVSEDMQKYTLESKDERSQFSRNHARIIVLMSCFSFFPLLVLVVFKAARLLA